MNIAKKILGRHQNAAHFNSFLSRSHCNVIPVRPLWESKQRNSVSRSYKRRATLQLLFGIFHLLLFNLR